MLDFLVDPWRSEATLRALAEVLLLGAACGPIGYWVTGYRLTYATESLAHGLLPGLVIATVAGTSLLLGAAGAAAVAVVLVALAAGIERTGADTGVAVVVTALVGIGGLIAFAADTPHELDHLLFGDPLAVADADLVAAAALALATPLVLAVLHRPLATTLFDAPSAAALRLRPGLVRVALLALLAIGVAIAAQGLGSLLSLALFVAPALAVGTVAKSVPAALVLAGATAMLASAAGIFAAYHLDTRAGAAVAIALCLAAAAGSLARDGRPSALRP